MEDESANTESAASSSSSGAGSSNQLTRSKSGSKCSEADCFYFDFDVAEFKPADRETLIYHARDLQLIR